MLLDKNGVAEFEAGCAFRSLYPALQRLLKSGWLKSEMGVSSTNRPVRIYKLTAAGRRHLEQEIASVEKMFAGITRVLALGS